MTKKHDEQLDRQLSSEVYMQDSPLNCLVKPDGTLAMAAPEFVSEEENEIPIEVNYNMELNDVDVMIINTGCPMTIVGRDWLIRYIKEHEVEEEELLQTLERTSVLGKGKTYTI